MANFIYGKAKQGLLNGDFNVASDTLKVLLVDSSYSPNQNTDEFVSSISSSKIKARSSALTNVTNVLGTLDADDININAYNGQAFKSLIIYKDTGNDSTSRLLAYIDSSIGIPFSGVNATTNITISWSNESNKIIAL